MYPPANQSFGLLARSRGPGGGGNYHIFRHGMCHFWGFFLRQKINFGMSFLVKSKVDINFRE